MTQISDDLYTGDAFYGAVGEPRGLKLAPIFAKEFGAVVTADADGICVAATATGAATLSATGALVSGGVATFDVARCVALTATSSNAAITYTVNGTDAYGVTISSKLAGPGATTAATTLKAFKTVTSITTTQATVGGITAGTSDTLGSPVRIADKGKVLGVFVDGVPESTLTVVAGTATNATSTATTGDVRGTLLLNTASNGAKRFTALVLVTSRNTKEDVYGVTQA
jgi:hypothetical protein